MISKLEFLLNETIDKIIRQAVDWKKIFAKSKSDKGLKPRPLKGFF